MYSFIGLPLLIALRKDPDGSSREKMAKLFSSPLAVLMIPATIMLVTQILLRPFFPEETHALIDDWAFFVQYLCFFLFGMIAYSSSTLWTAIGDNRKALLYATLVALLPFYTCYFNFRGLVDLPWSPDNVELVFDITALYVGWFTLITIIAFGQHFLNRPHPWLKFFNEGLYPFYILHQTVIIAVGYYVCQMPWSIALKFWTVSAVTLVVCITLFLFVIRPFRIMRLLFGLKPNNA